MKRLFAGIAVSIVLAVLGGSPGPGRAADAPAPPPDQPYPVTLRIGQVFEVCRSGQVICPIVRHLCDAPQVVGLVGTPDGLGITGVGPGTTLCMASGSPGPGRLFRITVRGPQG